MSEVPPSPQQVAHQQTGVLQGSGFPGSKPEDGSVQSLLSNKKLAFVVQGPGFRVQGSGFRFQVSRFRVQGSGYRVQGSGFRVQGSGFRVQGSGFRIQALNSYWRTPESGDLWYTSRKF